MTYKNLYLKYKAKLIKYKKVKCDRLIGRQKDVKGVELNDIDNLTFNNYVKKIKNEYFHLTYEVGGIITLLEIGLYEKTHTDLYDPMDNMIIYPMEMLNNIKNNQIIWHTHNVKRETRCEPPSGNDIIISYELALKNKYPFSLAIAENGIWIYKIVNELNDRIKDDFEGFKSWTSWIINTIADIYCSNDEEVLLKYDKEDLDEYGIGKINNVKEYYDIINRLFNGNLFIKFIEYV